MRTRDGRKVARAKGVFGKHPKLTKNQARHLVELNHSGGYSSAELFSVARSPAWRKRCSWCRQRDCLATLLGSDAAGSVPWFPHGAAAICWETGRVAARDVVIDRYLDYLDACNRRAWDELGRFLADTVLVNGRAETRLEYVENVKATTVAFPDYRWELLRAVHGSAASRRHWLARRPTCSVRDCEITRTEGVELCIRGQGCLSCRCSIVRCPICNRTMRATSTAVRSPGPW